MQWNLSKPWSPRSQTEPARGCKGKKHVPPEAEERRWAPRTWRGSVPWTWPQGRLERVPPRPVGSVSREPRAAWWSACVLFTSLPPDGGWGGVGGVPWPDALSHRVKPRGGTGYRPFAAGCRASGGGAAARQAVGEAGRGRVPSPWPQRCWAGSSGVWGDQPRARADLGDLLSVRKGVAHQLTGSCVSRRFSAHLTGRGGDTRCLWVKQGWALPAKGSPPVGTQGGRGCRLADAASTAGPKKRGNPPCPQRGPGLP